MNCFQTFRYTIEKIDGQVVHQSVSLFSTENEAMRHAAAKLREIVEQHSHIGTGDLDISVWELVK